MSFLYAFYIDYSDFSCGFKKVAVWSELSTEEKKLLVYHYGKKQCKLIFELGA